MADEGIIEQRAPVLELDPVHYPESDGRFLPENTPQALAIISVRNALDLHLAHVPNVILEGNKFIYYKKGNSTKCVAPDIYVLLDHVYKRPSPYKVWIEGKAPDFVLEVISPESEIRNRVDKKALYASLGVEEYFVFQPDEARGGERLVGYRLWGDDYVKLGPDPDSGPEGALLSKTLGVSLRAAGPLVRVRNLLTGTDYQSYREQSASLDAERARADAEKRRADAAESELAALKAKLATSER